MIARSNAPFHFVSDNSDVFVSYDAASKAVEDIGDLLRKKRNVAIAIRHFGNVNGGIGTTAATQSLRAFIDRQLANPKAPAPYCQKIRPDGASKEVRRDFQFLSEYFQTPPETRTRVHNILDLPFSHDLELLSGVATPAFLKEDLLPIMELKVVETPGHLRRGIQLPLNADRRWMLLSPFSAVSGVHMDKSGFMTWVVVSEGTKVWALIPPTKENLDHHRLNGHFGTLDGYSHVCILVLRPRDPADHAPGYVACGIHSNRLPCDRWTFSCPKPSSLKFANGACLHDR